MDRKHNIYAYTQDEFEDTKGVIRIHKSKERRHNGQNNTSIVISNHLIELKKKGKPTNTTHTKSNRKFIEEATSIAYTNT